MRISKAVGDRQCLAEFLVSRSSMFSSSLTPRKDCISMGTSATVDSVNVLVNQILLSGLIDHCIEMAGWKMCIFFLVFGNFTATSIVPLASNKWIELIWVRFLLLQTVNFGSQTYQYLFKFKLKELVHVLAYMQLPKKAMNHAPITTHWRKSKKYAT